MSSLYGTPAPIGSRRRDGSGYRDSDLPRLGLTQLRPDRPLRAISRRVHVSVTAVRLARRAGAK